MPDRYFVETPLSAGPARLSDSEAHHLAHVMRAKPGQQVTLFDGRGREALARIENIGRNQIELSVEECHEIDRELKLPITLGVALPKGDRQRWLIEKSVELGVQRLVPLVTQRGNQRESASGLEKLRRAVIEASKQCGRNRLMTIDEPQPVDQYWLANDGAAARLVAHPGVATSRSTLSETSTASPGVALAIGPEGGFTEQEIAQALAAGWQAVDLGARILRVETAALALVARLSSSPARGEDDESRQ